MQDGASGSRTPGRRAGLRRGPGARRRDGVGSGVVSGESTYQNGSASRPESTLRPGGRVGRRPGRGRRPGARRARRRSGTRKSMVAVGDVDVLPRRGVPFGVVAVQQRVRRPAVPDVGDLPRGVLGVGHPGVEAAGPERRDQVRRVAREQHPPDPHPVHDPRVEPVHRLPDDLVRPVADDLRGCARRAPPERPRRRGRSRRAPASRCGTCESGAGVDEHLAAGVPRGVEVEPPLVRPAGHVGADVADQEAVVERRARRTSRRASRRSRRCARRRRRRRRPRS